jgi:hypothetical protein
MSMLTHTSRMQGGVEPRYTTESRVMAKWLPPVMPLFWPVLAPVLQFQNARMQLTGATYSPTKAYPK